MSPRSETSHERKTLFTFSPSGKPFALITCKAAADSANPPPSSPLKPETFLDVVAFLGIVIRTMSLLSSSLLTPITHSIATNLKTHMHARYREAKKKKNSP